MAAPTENAPAAAAASPATGDAASVTAAPAPAVTAAAPGVAPAMAVPGQQVVPYQNAGYGGYPQPGGYGAAYGGAYPGQMGGYPGQPGGYPMQPGGYPGQPGQPGVPGGPEMAPQLNFRTMIRSLMEMAAVVQGVALIGTMANGWAQEVGSNEEQPLRKFGLWIYRSARGVLLSVLPFLAGRGRRAAFEDAWATETMQPTTRTRWWVVLGLTYFGSAFLQELLAYRRIRAARIDGAAAGVAPSADPRGETPGTASAEGDAAGGGGSSAVNNVVNFYMNKQRELHEQKTGQVIGSGAAPTGLLPATGTK